MCGLFAIGREDVRDPAYRWDGLTRSDGPLLLFQYTLSGEGVFESCRETYRIGTGRAFMAEIPSDHRYAEEKVIWTKHDAGEMGNHKRYLAWAQIIDESCLYIARMDTPWSIVTEPVKISAPEYDWEVQLHRAIEGPAVLIRNGRVFMAYSASGTDDRVSVLGIRCGRGAR